MQLENTTFESALDWLCFNIPGNELPIKFSSGVSVAAYGGMEGSIEIVSTARDDWVPQPRQIEEAEEGSSTVPLTIKEQRDELSLDLGSSSNKEWIKQYVEQEDEEDDTISQATAIIEEYHHAMLGEAESKKRGHKKNQKKIIKTLHKLEQDLSMLGISDETLMSELQYKHPEKFEVSSKPLDSKCSLAESSEGKPVNINSNEDFSVNEIDPAAPLLKTCTEENNDVEIDLDNLFSEEFSSDLMMPEELLAQQRKSSVSQHGYGHTVGNFDEIWKKGEPGRHPKAVLQKLCQRLGWDPPKYSKLTAKEDKLQYAVSILRLSSGRGKRRKAGGLITIQLPSSNATSKSVEDAQNKVASFALYQLFSDLPLSQMLVEPYSSFVSMWQKDEFSTSVEDNEDTRRANFVESLLNPDTLLAMPLVNSESAFIGENITGLRLPENTSDSPEETKCLSSTYSEITCSEAAESIFLKRELENKLKQPMYKKMLKDRAALPICKLKKDILQLLVENDVIVVCGETGCGKTTQVPQFILDDMILSGRGGFCNIICTQPRRLAAISVAERVSQERCESSPGSDDSVIGYQVRLDSARNKQTKLLFCTTGILLRKLAGNKDLDGFSHVIVDEVHERSVLGDFLIIFLKNLVEKQSNSGSQKLKVILMSATVDSSLFSRYFGSCPIICAEGRTYPVSTYFLEDVYEKLDYSLALDSPASGTPMTLSRKHKPGSVDDHRGKRNLVLSSWGDESLLSEDYSNPCYIPDHYVAYSERTRQNLKRLNEDAIDFDLLEDMIRFIDENYLPGAILVFLPGVAEIDLLVDKLTASFQFGRTSSDWILPLHSSLSPAEQRKVFLSPPESVRKVIVATDIAETSITIDDVMYVIDSGKHKEKHYNARKKMSSIVEDWISQANAKQRRGRAGRVKPGICFCLYTRHRFERLMRPFQVPEMLRVPLTELCLHIKSLSLGDIRSFLMKAIEPPREEAIATAIDLLYKVGAFQGDEELSPLGYHLAKLPVDVLIGKMMLYGAIFGCLTPVLSVAAFLSYKFPFLNPKDEKQTLERAKLALLNGSLDKETVSEEVIKQSDHLLLVIAYNKWAKVLHESGVKAAHQFCRSSLLNNSVMYMIRDMRVQFGSLLADIGLLDFPSMRMLSDGRRRDKLENWLSDLSQPFNRFANCSSVIKSILCAGLYPNVAATREGLASSTLPATKALSGVLAQNVWYDGKREVYIHPSSINHNVKQFQYPFLVFLEKVETSKVYLRDTSIISPYSILLFGGSMVIQHQVGLVIIDGWLKLNAPAQTAVLFKELRDTLHAVLKELIHKPGVSTFAGNEVVKSVAQLLLEEDKVHFSQK